MRWQRIVFSVTVTEGLLTEVSEKRKGCGRKAIPPVVARIFSGDSTSPLTRDGHGCPKLNDQRLCMDAKPTKRSYGKVDSAFCRIALLGFAIRINALVNIDEGKNQRD